MLQIGKKLKQPGPIALDFVLRTFWDLGIRRKLRIFSLPLVNLQLNNDISGRSGIREVWHSMVQIHFHKLYFLFIKGQLQKFLLSYAYLLIVIDNITITWPWISSFFWYWMGIGYNTDGQVSSVFVDGHSIILSNGSSEICWSQIFSGRKKSQK